MVVSRALVSSVLCFALPVATFAAESQVGYSVTYSGGSLPDVKGGEGLKLYLDATRVRLTRKAHEIVAIPALNNGRFACACIVGSVFRTPCRHLRG